MTEINKNSILKRRSLFNDNRPLNNNLHKVKYSSQNNITLLSKKDLNLSHSSKKKLNIVDFITQKKKFFIQNSFDVNGTKEFLASKEVAMRTMKLNDEIIEVNNNFLVGEKNYTNKNLIKLNYNLIEEDKKHYMKIEGKNTISPRKTRKSHKIKANRELILEANYISPKKTKKSKKFSKSPKKTKHKEAKNEYKKNSSIIDSESSEHYKKEKNKQNGDRDSLYNIYKFGTDNAKESEENLNQKLKKELKKVKNFEHSHENNHNNKEEKLRRKSINKNNPNTKKPKRHNSFIISKKKKVPNSFLFSEITKNLMKNDDDISISSIGINNPNDLKDNKVDKKVIKRKFASIEINNRKIKETLQKEMEKDKDNKKNVFSSDNEESNSEKESIISILSDLM